ncbi:VanW family protein [Galactobacter caseinivorans]|uniref:VanW family protein n=1 Tax=Galactobacter caseinivorans TaxID=2676123 RepID=UPI001314B790|nr:VanW family protein [Galactobacter caseinivorans]
MSENQPAGPTPGDAEDKTTPQPVTPSEAATPIAPPPESPRVSPQNGDAAPVTELDQDPAPTAVQPAVLAATSAPTDPEEPAVAAAPKRRKGKAVAWTICGVVVLAGAVYAGAAFLTQDKLPSQLTVEGVSLSGLSAADARTKLATELESRSDKALQLTAGEQSLAVKPSDAGLGVDVDATLDHLTGFSWDPQVISSRIFGSSETSAVQKSDPAKLTSAIETAAKDLDSKPVEGNLTFAQGKASQTAPKDGLTVDVEATAKAFKTQWLHSDGKIPATTTVAAPKVSAQAWDDFAKNTAAPLVAGPMTVSDGSKTATITAAKLGDAATVSTEGDKPALSLDGEKLVTDVVKANPAMKSSGQDATLKLEGSGGSAKPVVVPAKEGKGIDAKDLVAAVQKASATTDRTATVELKVTAPTVTTAQAQKWNADKVVAKLSTIYPTYDSVRTKNLRTGAAKVNGTVVLPGQEFNLAKEFGAITAENGYYSSGVVENGVSTKAMGGGISQIATMSYNAGFLSGAEMLQYKAHSRWFDRYPVGQESTYWEGQINVRWKNTTDAPVVVQMWVTDSHVKMQVWGKQYWDVKTKTGAKYAFTSPRTIKSNAASCTPESTGKQGFSIKVTRQLTHNGEAKPLETYNTTYGAWPNVSCG